MKVRLQKCPAHHRHLLHNSSHWKKSEQHFIPSMSKIKVRRHYLIYIWQTKILQRIKSLYENTITERSV